MKTKLFFPVLLSLAFAAGTGCSKKSDDGPTVKDCEKNNYGVFKVTYGSSTVRHGVVATLNGMAKFREKISSIGITSDTLRLRPGTYGVEIASIDAQGRALSSTTRTLTITQCGEATASVTF